MKNAQLLTNLDSVLSVPNLKLKELTLLLIGSEHPKMSDFEWREILDVELESETFAKRQRDHRTLRHIAN